MIGELLLETRQIASGGRPDAIAVPSPPSFVEKTLKTNDVITVDQQLPRAIDRPLHADPLPRSGGEGTEVVRCTSQFVRRPGLD